MWSCYQASGWATSIKTLKAASACLSVMRLGTDLQEPGRKNKTQKRVDSLNIEAKTITSVFPDILIRWYQDSFASPALGETECPEYLLITTVPGRLI